MADKLTLSVAETAELLGLSRPKVYDLIKLPDFPSFAVGNWRLISADGLRRWIAEQAGEVTCG